MAFDVAVGQALEIERHLHRRISYEVSSGWIRLLSYP